MFLLVANFRVETFAVRFTRADDCFAALLHRYRWAGRLIQCRRTGNRWHRMRPSRDRDLAATDTRVAAACCNRDRTAASGPLLLVFDAGDPHRLGPERNIRGDQRGELCRSVAERIDAEVIEPLGKARVLCGRRNFGCDA